MRRREARSFVWTGAAKDGKWGSAENWKPVGVPGRLDTVKLGREATIDLGRDRMVSNIVFTTKVILAGGAVHAQNTAGRGAKAKLGVRAGSLLGRVALKDGAVVAPLRGMAGYRGVLEEDADGVSRVVLTRPGASFVWTGAAGDGAWANERNWSVGGRVAMEPPTKIDQVIFQAGRKTLAVTLPEGVTVVSNLVAEVPIVWKRTGKVANLDILDLAGNGAFTVRGDATVCVKGGSDVPIVAAKGTTLALAAHGGKPYCSVTLEKGATLVPYDWPVNIGELVLKGENEIRFWPPRHFNKWRPLWVVHAQKLEGDVNLVCDDMAHWRQNVETWNDSSRMVTISRRE